MKCIIVGLFICSILVLKCNASTEDTAIVSISNGPIKGEVRNNRLTWGQHNNRTKYWAFHAIPYAKPPVSQLRFKPPEKFTERWDENNPYDASDSTKTPICPQLANKNFMNIPEDQFNEDCLYLSVYGPSLTKRSGNSSLPVLVWIHGGSFDRGTGMFPYHGPERFIGDDDIIMVSINYRVGILGFLSLGTQDIPGNMGLHDQVMALRWVQENIHAFGGDSNTVTIMGESAGSWSGYYHLFSPSSKREKLFHRIIAQSGTPMSPAYHEYPGEMAERFGQSLAGELGCGANTTKYNRLVNTNQAECLRNLTAEYITKQPSTYGRSKLGPKGTQAVIDGAYSDTPFLPKSTRTGLKSGDYYSDVDILLGSNKDDGLEFTAQLYKNSELLKLYRDKWFDPNYNFGAQNLFIVEDYKNIDESLNQTVEEITNFYLGDIEYLDIYNITHFTTMFTDAWYFFAAYDFVSKHLPNTGNGNNIYQYHYTHQGDNALSVELGYGGPYGVGHCDETFLQFHPYMNKKFVLSHIDNLQSNMLVTSWKNFVKFGDPSTNTVKWDPIKNLDDRGYLNIKLSSVMEYSSDVDKRMKLWDGLINPNQVNSGNVFQGIFGFNSLYCFIMLYFFFI